MNILHLCFEYPKENSFVPEGSNNIYVCTNPPEKAIQAKTGIKIPRGEFDIESVIRELGVTPGLVSISSSLSLLRNAPIPKGIEKLKCPSVMKFTDSHHMHHPIRTLIKYAHAVNCKYHWTTYNRNHVHFYKEAGLKNVFWMPGSISIPYLEVARQEKKYDVGFCGSLEGAHPIRKKYITFLRENHVNVHVERRSYAGSLEMHSTSRIAFNCSLNGDLNRRVFEVLMAGGFLMTDRLSQQSGLFELFREGEHIECYKDENELLEKVKYYLANPQKAAAVAQAGHALFMKEYHPEIVNRQFYDYLTHGGSINPKFVNVIDNRIGSIDKESASDAALRVRICLYEIVQELHKQNAKLKVLVLGDGHETASGIADLSRAEINYYSDTGKVEASQKYFNDKGAGRIHVRNSLPAESMDVIILTNGLTDEKAERFLPQLRASLLVMPKSFKSNKILPGVIANLGYKKITMREPESNRSMADDLCLIYQKEFLKDDNTFQVTVQEKAHVLRAILRLPGRVFKKVARKFK